VAAFIPDAPLPAPHQTDHVDGLLGRFHRLAGGPPRTAHGHNGVPERSGSQAQLHPAAGEDVEGGGGLGQDGRRPKREAGHVGEEPDPGRPAGQVGDERPGVEESPLVGVVLDPDEVEAGLVRHLGQPQDLLPLQPAGVMLIPNSRGVVIQPPFRPAAGCGASEFMAAGHLSTMGTRAPNSMFPRLGAEVGSRFARTDNTDTQLAPLIPFEQQRDARAQDQRPEERTQTQEADL
jgi:hypothetical protein